MKLKKTKDVRVGQVWSFNNGETYDVVIDVLNTDDNYDKHHPYEVIYEIYNDFESDGYTFKDIEYCRREEPVSNDTLEMFKQPDKYLVGFIGITHKIEDGKLVEIERNEDFIELENGTKVYKDDVVALVIYPVSDSFEICYVSSIKNNPNDKEFGVSLFNGDLSYNTKMGKSEYASKYITKKLGTIGVNYEFVNNLI